MVDMRLFLCGFVLTCFVQVKSDCIPLKDCAAAVKHVNLRRYDPQTIKILREAHCGLEFINGKREAKVRCEKVSDFSNGDDSNDCISIYDCPEALHLVNTTRRDPQTTVLLRSLACPDAVRKDLINCKKISARMTGTRKDKIKLLLDADQCGLQTTTQNIMNGKTAELDDFPWAAIIKYRNRKNEIKFGCGGTLINSKYVVSAAHCIDLDPSRRATKGDVYLVVLGEHDIRNETDCSYNDGKKVDCNEPVKIFEVEKAFAHPGFSHSVVYNDIGLIRLKGRVTFSDFVKPVCLPLNPLQIDPTEILQITGWGITEKRSMSYVKLKASIFFITNEDCKSFYNDLKLNSGQICAGSTSGSDFCNGDSGGPLMAMRLRNGGPQTFLIGVISTSFECGLRASIYTNVTHHLDWILDNIEE